MSVKEPIRTQQDPNLTGSNPAIFLSLNDIFNERIRKAQLRPGKVKIVARCESLPMVAGDREELATLFDILISLMIDNSPPGSDLLLYVNCKTGQPFLSKNKGFLDYVIKFHTNLTTNEGWKDRNKEALYNCEQIINRHRGSFLVNNIFNTGCLFSISLPGKIH